MARAKSRFTQAEVTKLIKAARGTGFECVTIEVLPGAEGLRAIYTIGPPPKEEPSALETWKAQREREKRAANGAIRKKDGPWRTRPSDDLNS